MNKQTYTLAMYRVKAGHEGAFISAWDDLADTFSSLPNPPVWGTLIRHQTDQSLFYSFGPWHSAEHVNAMRENPEASAAFARLDKLCVEMMPGNYEMVTHVNVQSGEVI